MSRFEKMNNLVSTQGTQLTNIYKPLLISLLLMISGCENMTSKDQPTTSSKEPTPRTVKSEDTRTESDTVTAFPPKEEFSQEEFSQEEYIEMMYQKGNLTPEEYQNALWDASMHRRVSEEYNKFLEKWGDPIYLVRIISIQDGKKTTSLEYFRDKNEAENFIKEEERIIYQDNNRNIKKNKGKLPIKQYFRIDPTTIGTKSLIQILEKWREASGNTPSVRHFCTDALNKLQKEDHDHPPKVQ